MPDLTQPLNDGQLIRLHRDLVAPVAVYDVLQGHTPMDDTSAYTLDTLLGELPPDAALIALALCTAHVAEHLGQRHPPTAAMLGFEAGRIAHEFGPAWIAHADGRLRAQDEGHVMTLLEQMPEDFEALRDLLDAASAGLEENSVESTLCALLGDMAGTFVDYLASQGEEPVCGLHNPYLSYGDNIVSFPRPYRPH